MQNSRILIFFFQEAFARVVIFLRMKWTEVGCVVCDVELDVERCGMYVCVYVWCDVD